MNLEDRLRSHLHSGDDLFVETGPNAGQITAAGRRRTRRNQIGGAAAGGMLALGLVFGVASQTGDGEQEEFANDAPSFEESAALPADPEASETNAAESTMSEIESADLEFDDVAGDDEIRHAHEFVEYEVIVGVGDGFAGLRATGGGIMAIRSDDGDEWSSTPTIGIPDRAEITGIEHDDGVFAAPFVVYDELAASFTSYIGTSADLATWAVDVVDFGDEFDDPFLNELVIANGEVIAVVLVGPPFDDVTEQGSDPSIFILRGPAGGPYASTILPDVGFGVSELTAADDVVMFVVTSDEGARVWASTSSGPWALVRDASLERFPTLASVGSSVFVFDGLAVERSSDGGRRWDRVEVDGLPDYSGATTMSSGDTLAALFVLASDEVLDAGYVLAAGPADEFVIISTDNVLPDNAFVLLAAVNNEEALLEVFSEPDEFEDDLAASSGIVEDDHDDHDDEDSSTPRYVRIPLG